MGQLDRADPLSFGPKFPEILVEWIAPMYPRAVAKMSSCQVHAISRRGMDHFRYIKFILGSEAWGNKTKKCTIHCRASRSFLLFYSLKPAAANYEFYYIGIGLLCS